MTGTPAPLAVPLCVVKVGGSLFSSPGLPTALRDWLARRPSRRHVLLAGGGELADVIRAADERFGLGQEASHDLCLDVLRVTARWLAALLPELPLVDDHERLRSDATPAHSAVIFEPSTFFRSIEPTLPGRVVRRHWDVTSDSLAARLAEVLDAGELVLLKSAPPEPGETVEAAAMRGYVDRDLPEACRGVQCVRFESLEVEGSIQLRLPLTDRSLA